MTDEVEWITLNSTLDIHTAAEGFFLFFFLVGKNSHHIEIFKNIKLSIKKSLQSHKVLTYI